MGNSSPPHQENLLIARIPDRTAWVTTNIDLRLTVRTSSQSRLAIPFGGWGRLMPVLFTRICFAAD